MKDKLKRDINKGDVIAYLEIDYGRPVPLGRLALYDVIGVAEFAIQVRAHAGGGIEVLPRTEDTVIVKKYWESETF